MTPTDNLAAAARKLCVARAGEGYDTLEHELAHALDDYDQQEILKVRVRNRLTAAFMRTILAEEMEKSHLFASHVVAAVRLGDEDGYWPIRTTVAAYMGAATRVANYAEHLVKMMVMLCDNFDIGDAIYKVRESEGLGWEGPKVKAYGQACGAILGEVEACRVDPPKPAADPVALPLGHA